MKHLTGNTCGIIGCFICDMITFFFVIYSTTFHNSFTSSKELLEVNNLSAKQIT